MPCAIVIPARYASSRLPGKPLAEIHGKPLIQWVYEVGKRARNASRIVVATDDERIVQAVQAFGGEAMMTRLDHVSGSDRVAEVAQKLSENIIVNLQGDEPLMEPSAIDAAIELIASGRFRMATLMTPLESSAELQNPAVVKVIADRNDRAIYFSRFGIPYSREQTPSSGFVCRRHLGLYAYERQALFEFQKLPESRLERAESLEQLRALEAGWAIGVREVKVKAIGVDTPEELEKARALLKGR